MGREQRAESRKKKQGSKMPLRVPQNEPKRAQDAPKWSQKRPKTTPRAASEGQKSEPKPQDEKRTEPRRSQDRPGAPKGQISQDRCAPRGPFGSPKRHPSRLQNDQKSKQKITRQKSDPRRSWTRLGAILGRFGAPSWAKKTSGTICFKLFREKSLFRR